MAATAKLKTRQPKQAVMAQEGSLMQLIDPLQQVSRGGLHGFATGSLPVASRTVVVAAQGPQGPHSVALQPVVNPAGWRIAS